MGKATDKPGTADAGTVGDVTKVVTQAEAAALQPLPVPEGGWPADEFTGLGGDYVRDPYTGVRSRANPGE